MQPRKPTSKSTSARKLLDKKAMKGTKGGDASTTVVSPRDPQSGLPTGQRMHKPYTIA